MRQYNGVIGSQEVVQRVEVGMDTVYVRTGVERITINEQEFWQYDEVQYTLPEYIHIMQAAMNEKDAYQVEMDFRLTLLEMGM